MKPILFNTKMVQAILEGRKTTTRRIVKDIDNKLFFIGFASNATPESNNGKAVFANDKFLNRAVLTHKKLPYKIGDILYVRETWKVHSMKNYDKNIKILYKAEPNDTLNEIHVSNERYEEYFKFMNREGWIPNIHMPKEAARLFLKVTNIKVEKLQNITVDEILKEGVWSDTFNNYFGSSRSQLILESWEYLWNSTVNNKDKDRYGWCANPFVFVIEFERIDKSEVEHGKSI